MEGWRKSSYSDGNGGNCVEVGADGAILVRDTANRDGGTLSFTADTTRPKPTASYYTWTAFSATLR
jgi:hypothetical protein